MKLTKDKLKEIILEEIERLDEKLITYGNRAPYGQIVFLAGGAGSGKGFAVKNFIDSASYKIRDVDEWKKSFMKIAALKNKYKEIQNLKLKNPKDVFKLHQFVKKIGLEDKTLSLMLSQAKAGRLPNIIFDVTMKDASKLNKYIPMLLEFGYSSKDIHLTWVLTSYHLAVKQNQNRERVVPDDILLGTHEGAANTMYDLLTRGLPKGLDGRIDVILNNRENTVAFKNADGEPIKVNPQYSKDFNDKGEEVSQIVVKDFLYLPIKKQGGGLIPEKSWKQTLWQWIRDNAPKTITNKLF